MGSVNRDSVMVTGGRLIAFLQRLGRLTVVAVAQWNAVMVTLDCESKKVDNHNELILVC